MSCGKSAVRVSEKPCWKCSDGDCKCRTPHPHISMDSQFNSPRCIFSINIDSSARALESRDTCRSSLTPCGWTAQRRKARCSGEKRNSIRNNITIDEIDLIDYAD